jgi:hypothetical protein
MGFNSGLKRLIGEVDTGEEGSVVALLFQGIQKTGLTAEE